jgi:Haem-degrading
MASNSTEIAMEGRLASNPLDVVPDEIPFDVPYGPPISLDRAEAVIHAAVAEAKRRNWKMNIAVADSGGNLVAFQRMDGAMLASIQIAETQGAGSRNVPAPDKGLRGRYPANASLPARVRWGNCVSRRHSTDRPGADYRRNRLFGRDGFPGRDR